MSFTTNAGNILQSGAAGLNLANAITLTQNGVVDSNGNTFTLSGAISGASSLTKQGLGILVLPNANTYGGGTVLTQGTLRVGDNASLGTGTLLFTTNAGSILQSGAGGLNLANAIALTQNGSVDTQGNLFTLSGVISGSGSLTKLGTGILELDNANSYNGGTIFTDGTLRVGTNTSLGLGTLTFSTNAGNLLFPDVTGLNILIHHALTKWFCGYQRVCLYAFRRDLRTGSLKLAVGNLSFSPWQHLLGR